MSYTPTNWKAGDKITSQRLNKLEQGVADAGGGGSGDSGVFAFDIVPDETAGIALSATWQEIHDAIEDNKFCVGFIDSSSSDDFSKSSFIVVSVQTDSASDQPYMVSLFAGQELMFATDTADGHPGLVQNGAEGEPTQAGG